MGVGMPAALLLHEFGSQCIAMFGPYVYHVGSSLNEKSGWRDVDIRVILPDEEYAAMNLGAPGRPSQNAKWVSLCLAYSALGKALTGLPIDFQIQQQTRANDEFDGARSFIGLVPFRCK